jgi:hypothetical protein
MVKITIASHLYDREEGDPVEEGLEEATDQLQTVIYIPEGENYKELKEQNSSIRWDTL